MIISMEINFINILMTQELNVLNIKSDRPLEEVQKEIREKIGY